MSIGYHVSLDDLIKGSSLYQSTAVQIFVSSPMTWACNEIKQARLKKYNQASHINNIDLVVHGKYLINFCSNDKDILKNSQEAFVKQIMCCKQLGIKYYVLHPGSSSDTEVGENNLCRILNKYQAFLVQSDVIVCIENMAGQGNSLGGSFKQIRYILDNTHANVMFCLDTCHAFAYGYDIEDSKFDLVGLVDSEIGLQNMKVIHLNGSKTKCKSRVDRHSPIGDNYINYDNLTQLIATANTMKIPMILETKDKVSQQIKKVKNICKQSIE